MGLSDSSYCCDNCSRSSSQANGVNIERARATLKHQEASVPKVRDSNFPSSPTWAKGKWIQDIWETNKYLSELSIRIAGAAKWEKIQAHLLLLGTFESSYHSNDLIRFDLHKLQNDFRNIGKYSLMSLLLDFDYI